MATRSNLDFVHDVKRAAALLHPLRRRIIEQLDEPNSATGLARQLSLPRQKVNYHLRELEREGFVELVEERKKGNCVERVVRATARTYLLDPALLGAIGADPSRVQDHFSSTYLVAVLARALRELALVRERAEKAGKRLATLSLESEIAFASPEARTSFAEELTGEFTRLVAKYHDENASGARHFQFVIGAYPSTQRKQAKSSDGRCVPNRRSVVRKQRSNDANP